MVIFKNGNIKPSFDEFQKQYIRDGVLNPINMIIFAVNKKDLTKKQEKQLEKSIRQIIKFVGDL